MTLLVVSVACGEAIVVADRRLTDQKGKIVTESSYKLFTYVNPQQGYQCVVGFTGLAMIAKRLSTTDWLMRILPKTLTPNIPLLEAIPKLADECTARFARISLADPTWTRTLFVMCGWQELESAPPLSGRFAMPFIGFVGNCIDETGKQMLQVTKGFSHVVLSPNLDRTSNPARFVRRSSYQLYRGDIRAVERHSREWIELVRFLRRPISHYAKVKLTVDFIRTVAGDRSGRSTIGRDLLSMVLPQDGLAIGGDWHEDKNDMSMTMPHFVSADGAIMTDFRVSPLAAPHP